MSQSMKEVRKAEYTINNISILNNNKIDLLQKSFPSSQFSLSNPKQTPYSTNKETKQDSLEISNDTKNRRDFCLSNLNAPCGPEDIHYKFVEIVRKSKSFYEDLGRKLGQQGEEGVVFGREFAEDFENLGDVVEFVWFCCIY